MTKPIAISRDQLPLDMRVSLLTARMERVERILGDEIRHDKRINLHLVDMSELAAANVRSDADMQKILDTIDMVWGR